MREMNYLDAMALTTDRMAHGGVFLTVPGDGEACDNTMTIGWGTMGYSWGKPVFMAMVRPSRHTYALLNRAGRFTVSVPHERALADALKKAGTLSGRDGDKFAACGIEKAAAQKIVAPIVAGCALHIECTILNCDDMTGESLSPAIKKSAYPSGDLHRLFFGEIVACYAEGGA